MNDLDEALRLLNEASKENSQNIKRLIEKDYRNLRETMDKTFEESKSIESIEKKVKEDPWRALGITALIFLFVGFIFGKSK
jgi:ElaB/YqjD/DUF883 family membrane-anchored ribosome-binding protein